MNGDYQTVPDTNLTSQDHEICVAVATPPGQSGIAVIRLSGKGAAELIDPVFKPVSKRFPPVFSMPGYTCAVGKIISPVTGELIDQVVLTRFTAPHSYTGEEVIELSCHGSLAIKQSLIDLILSLGARAAEPGEFTKRAFLNGKLDLIQAEAVIDLIQAETDRSARNAAALLQGELSQQMMFISDSLYQLLASIELVLEYPEHDESDTVTAQLAAGLDLIEQKINRYVQGFSQGRILTEGMTVVLAGRPNAGKSSLLNALANTERAIVTDVPGTTRDTIEIKIDIDGIPVHLVDTAGVRETEDKVEKLGVARTRDVLQSADLVFWLIAPPVDHLQEDQTIMEQLQLQSLVPLVSKDDLNESLALRQAIEACWPDQTIMTCSVITGEGLDAIRKKVIETYESLGAQAQNDVLLTNSRHKACLDSALLSVRKAREALHGGITWDIIASLVRGSLDALAELTGDAVSDTLVDTIFSRFCVGK